MTYKDNKYEDIYGYKGAYPCIGEKGGKVDSLKSEIQSRQVSS